MYLVIDIGGTKTLIAVFNERGKIIKKTRFETPHDLAKFLNTLLKNLEPIAESYRLNISPSQKNPSTETPSKILQITVAIPGIVRNNHPIKFGNRPWKNPPIADTINKLFSCPILFLNDANLATLFESRNISGRAIYLTFSTGIGGGIAKDGKITKTSDAFEPGHTIYEFKDKKLEWEDIASCNAIGEFYGCPATSVRGRKNYLDIAHRLSLGLTDIIKDQHPDTIIIGGPLGLRYRHFSRPLKRYLKISLPDTKLPRLKPARRPKESVIYGGYLASKTALKSLKHHV